MTLLSSLARVALFGAPLLVASSVSAITLDFESSNPFSGGTLSTDQSFSGSQSLRVDAGQNLTYTLPAEYIGQDLIITMNIYDMGKWIDLNVTGRPDSVVGPRWGISGGAHDTKTQTVAAGILQRKFGSGMFTSTQGYALLGADTSFTGTWFSPIHYTGSSRSAFMVPGTGGSNDGSGWVAGTGGGGTWTKWTFVVSATGQVSEIKLGSLTYTASNAAKNIGSPVDRLQLFGGATGALSGMYVDDISVSLANVPEPSTYAAALGMIALGVVVARRRRNA